jgi:hypothetical protein
MHSLLSVFRNSITALLAQRQRYSSTQWCNLYPAACCAALPAVQVRKASFIRHWQLLGVHGQPRQLQCFEVRSAANLKSNSAARLATVAVEQR